MLRIAVDLDGTLADTMVVWCELCNRKYGTNLAMEDLTEWGGWRIAGITRDQFFRLLDEAWFEWERIPAVEQAIGRKISEVSKLGTIDIVTGRSPRTVQPAKRWLKHYDLSYKRFIRVMSTEDKIHLDYDVFVDDSPLVFEPISRRPGRYVIAYTRPWNTSIRNLKRVFRVSSWSEVPKALHKVATKQVGHSEQGRVVHN